MMDDFAEAAGTMKMDKVIWLGNDQQGGGLSSALNALPTTIVKMSEQLKAMTGINLEETLRGLLDKTIDKKESPARKKPAKK